MTIVELDTQGIDSIAKVELTDRTIVVVEVNSLMGDSDARALAETVREAFPDNRVIVVQRQYALKFVEPPR